MQGARSDDAGGPRRAWWSEGRAGGRGSPEVRTPGAGAGGWRGSSGVEDGWDQELGRGGAWRSVLAGGVGSPVGTQHCEQDQLHHLRGPHYAPLSVCEDRDGRASGRGALCACPARPIVLGWCPGPALTLSFPCPPPPARGRLGRSQQLGPRGLPPGPPRAGLVLRCSWGPALKQEARPDGSGLGSLLAGAGARGEQPHTLASLSSSLFQRNLHVTEFGVICF